MASTLKIGDRVGYSASFLRSTGLYAGEEPFMRGTVTAFEDISQGFVLAVVDWGHGHSRKVNVKNLARLGTIAWAGV
jgi:hypothetical protein